MLNVTPLQLEHLDDASAIVTSRYKMLFEDHPLLPDCYLNKQNVLPLLQNLYQSSPPGVATFQEGQLVGFLTAWLMPDFRGKRSIYSPEWAHGAIGVDRRFIYELMYQEIAADWVKDKYVAHYISFFAGDHQAINTWFWLGFGLIGVDAVRGLEPILDTNPQVQIRPAGQQDIDKIMKLHDELVDFAKGSPDFFIADQFDANYFQNWLRDPDKVIWLAFLNNKPLAFFRFGPANDDVCTIIFEEDTTSIYGAYTSEAYRGRKIATSILAWAIESARDNGYQRIAVDFESMNVLATQFWLGHDFEPVCFSLVRYIDERAT